MAHEEAAAETTAVRSALLTGPPITRDVGIYTALYKLY